MSAGSIKARFRLAYPEFTLDVDLDLPGRGVTALFGHSGSGKTTLLRLIAGLTRAPDGYLSMKGEVWQDGRTFLPTHKRSLGYVFQEASLFPHLTARGNLEYGMKRSAERLDAAALDHVIDLLGIGALLKLAWYCMAAWLKAWACWMFRKSNGRDGGGVMPTPIRPIMFATMKLPTSWFMPIGMVPIMFVTAPLIPGRKFLTAGCCAIIPSMFTIWEALSPPTAPARPAICPNMLGFCGM